MKSISSYLFSSSTKGIHSWDVRTCIRCIPPYSLAFHFSRRSSHFYNVVHKIDFLFKSSYLTTWTKCTKSIEARTNYFS